MRYNIDYIKTVIFKPSLEPIPTVYFADHRFTDLLVSTEIAFWTEKLETICPKPGHIMQETFNSR